jgi:hypothetical protein
MKVILEIKDSSHFSFFMELVKSLDYISVVREIKDERKSQFISDLAESFNDVKLFEKDLLNEI